MNFTSRTIHRSLAAGTSTPENRERPAGKVDTSAYFKQLKMRLRVGFLIAVVVPFAALSVYFHFQFTRTLKESAKLNLVAVAESQRNIVDLFLQERVVNIFSQFQSEQFSLAPSEERMERYLKSLRRASDAFIDVGFLNERGAQIGYAGPFPFLQGRVYADEKWFVALAQQGRSYFISDIYLGFRNKPHFTIAVKQVIDGNQYVLRSTLDPDKFYMFLRTIGQDPGVDSFLVNEDGTFQIVDPKRGELLGASDFKPAHDMETWVDETDKNGARALIAYSRLREVPWVLVVQAPIDLAHGRMIQARRLIIAGILLVIAVVATLIWMTIDKLVGKVQDSAEKREQLQMELVHASKLASVGELATGVAHEINNPLAIVMATSGVIRDMLNPEFDLESSPESIVKELDTIDSAIFRARTITRQLLDFGRKDPPRPVACNLNRLLDDLLTGFKQRAFEVENITIEKHYDPQLPEIVADSDQIRQVFLNLINNAGDAIRAPGKITISTARDGGHVRITVTDTGQGMTADQIKKIFDPFFTTKPAGRGTGLGLSVSQSLVKSMGGSIDVQSMPGAGSAFTVSLPITINEREDDAAIGDLETK